MASKPEPPESIILQAFTGVKNTVAAERLTAQELEAAVNVDLDDAGQLRRRRGYTLRAAGSYHSLYSTGDQLLGVKDNVLGIIDTAYGFTPLTAASADRVSYVTVGPVTYFSSATVSGKLLQGAVSPWGAVVSEGEWVSPVITPTDTLGAVAGKLLGAPPMATELAIYKGRIYLAAGRLLWATELYAYDYVDKTRSFYQFEHDITMVQAMDDGLYVGTQGGLYFMAGLHSDGLKRTMVAEDAVIPGSSVVVPASRAHPAAREGRTLEGSAVMFLTAAGVCAGFDGGEVHNLTRGKVVLPLSTRATALYRDQDGVNQFVAVADSGGTPSAAARIGDYVDAEVRRFQGG